MNGFWTRMARRGPGEVLVSGVLVGPGSRVRLHPKTSPTASSPTTQGPTAPSPTGRADIFDLVLDGRVAIVESVEQDDEGILYVAVTLDDDPGRDLGEARLPGHRFFYSVDEIEPLGEPGERLTGRVLVAGIGNVFLGDDGFGVEVVRRLAEEPALPGVDVVDFGIRGMDLAYALQRDYAAVIFVDAAARGHAPGTLTVLDPDLPDVADGSAGAPVETHGMDPVRVLWLARTLGRVPDRVRVVCCEPATVEEALFELSEPVRAMIGEAANLVKSLVMDMITENTGPSARAPQ
ncbi:hydrogenase maturation protease [Nonomuraea jiangxiensis]|uniref:Hydrogenase maturation protease n=1 Tax=Nonomuraea jiangxiensis TaxID=633440 RepID=A0A1G8T776_9ACTN|nr:hydrogenase maturation protease [Nonomuraea jiangxiensis]SDJ37436.1 hydrogenase maturation protease [Nonomuraea jiangxiensis]